MVLIEACQVLIKALRVWVGGVWSLVESGVWEHPSIGIVTKWPQNWSPELMFGGKRHCTANPVDLEGSEDLKAVWPEMLGSFFGRFSAELGPLKSL